MDEVTRAIRSNLKYIRNRHYMEQYADKEAAEMAALTYERATYYGVPPMTVVEQVIKWVREELPNAAYCQALDDVYPMEETVLKRRKR